MAVLLVPHFYAILEKKEDCDKYCETATAELSEEEEVGGKKEAAEE